MASRKAGSIADLAEQRKRRKYGELENRFFYFSQWHPTHSWWQIQSSATLLNDLDKRIIEAVTDGRAAEFFLRRLSAEMRKGNAAEVLRAL